MSSKVTINQSKGVRVVGLLAVIAGIVLILAGAVTGWQVAVQLRAENITVSEDASFLAGKRVQDPFTAYAQAEVINKHALEMADGKTYAELAQDDPVRATVMNASFLRASLFTSVVAFGLAALVLGLGIFLILLGWALRRVAGGPAIVVETFEGGPTPRHGGAPRDDDLAALTGSVPVVAPRKQAPVADTPAAAQAESTESGAAPAPLERQDDERPSTELETTPDGVVLPPEASADTAAEVPTPAAGTLGGAPVGEQLRRRGLAERRAAAEREASSRSAAAGAWAASRTGAIPQTSEPQVPASPLAEPSDVEQPGAEQSPEAAPVAPSAAPVPSLPVPVPADAVPVPVDAADASAEERPTNPWARIERPTDAGTTDAGTTGAGTTDAEQPDDGAGRAPVEESTSGGAAPLTGSSGTSPDVVVADEAEQATDQQATDQRDDDQRDDEKRD